jgi:hypothetical protein
LKIMGPPLYSQGKVTDDKIEYSLSQIRPPLENSRTALLIVDVQPGELIFCHAVPLVLLLLLFLLPIVSFCFPLLFSFRILEQMPRGSR